MKKNAAHNSVYLAIAGEMVNRRLMVLRKFVLISLSFTDPCFCDRHFNPSKKNSCHKNHMPISMTMTNEKIGLRDKEKTSVRFREFLGQL